MTRSVELLPSGSIIVVQRAQPPIVVPWTWWSVGRSAAVTTNRVASLRPATS